MQHGRGDLCGPARPVPTSSAVLRSAVTPSPAAWRGLLRTIRSGSATRPCLSRQWTSNPLLAYGLRCQPLHRWPGAPPLERWGTRIQTRFVSPTAEAMGHPSGLPSARPSGTGLCAGWHWRLARQCSVQDPMQDGSGSKLPVAPDGHEARQRKGLCLWIPRFEPIWALTKPLSRGSLAMMWAGSVHF
jgi:hypothetical protein